MNSKLDSWHAVWNFTTTQFSRALLVLSVALIGLAEARAQQPDGQPPPPPPPATLLPGIEVLPTSYLWFPWISAGVRPADTRLGSPSNTIDPGKLYSHLTWVPFMGQAEFRSDSLGVVTDFIHAPLKSGISTRDILFGSGTGEFTLNQGSAVVLYRALALPDQSADIGLGFRAWGLGGQITLSERRQRLPPVTVAGRPAGANRVGRSHSPQ